MPENMCKKCNDFYANETTNFMCSLCYKEYKTTVKQAPQESNESKSKQEDHNHCYTCSRKVGLLGFKCKSCMCSYCKSHRLPEDHSCQVDYRETARKQIQKQNPNITAPKIEQF